MKYLVYLPSVPGRLNVEQEIFLSLQRTPARGEVSVSLSLSPCLSLCHSVSRFLSHGNTYQVLKPFLTFIKFHMIPAKILMTEIYPLNLVSHT